MMLKSFGVLELSRRHVNLSPSNLLCISGRITHRLHIRFWKWTPPGIHSPNLFNYDYKKLRHPIHPLDSNVTYAKTDVS